MRFGPQFPVSGWQKAPAKAHSPRLRRHAGGAVVWSRLRRLRRDTSGHAFLEAALIFPIMISLFLGISEFGEALTVSRRTEAAAGTGADLVARLRTVSTAELGAIKPMIEEMFRPFPTTSIGLVISSVVADDDNTTTVAWSYADGAGASAHNAGSTMALPAGLTEPNTSVIVAEVSYTFNSTLAVLIVGDKPMRAEGYMRPRLVNEITKAD
jgi:Flp pilus assembly protein TadG